MGLKFRHQTFDVAGETLTLKVLRDLSQFDDPDGVASKLGISEQAFTLFGIVWASSEVLAHYLSTVAVTSEPILEVGCGMALVSHYLNKRGCDVSAMDIHPIAGELLAANTTLNQSPAITFHHASWSDPEIELGKFGLIVGSDILYEPRHAMHLGGFIDRHGADHCDVIIVDPDRGQNEHFENDMIRAGFVVRRITPTFVDHLDLSYHGNIYVYSR